jgi:predicted nuclease with TOPRIM domain
MRQSTNNDPAHKENNKNSPGVLSVIAEFEQSLAGVVKLEKERREAGEKIAAELGHSQREIVRLQTEIAQLNEKFHQRKDAAEVDAIKDDLDIDFDALKKQGESTDDLLQSTAKSTQAHLESSVTHQASTVDRVKKDIDLCNNLQSKLQAERAALSSGVIDRVMNWRKISEIDKNLKEVTAKKTDRESMLKEANASLDAATKDLEAHKKSFGADDGAKVDNVGTKTHISFHGHGDHAPQVKLAHTGPNIQDLTRLVPKGHAPR